MQGVCINYNAVNAQCQMHLTLRAKQQGAVETAMDKA